MLLLQQQRAAHMSRHGNRGQGAGVGTFDSPSPEPLAATEAGTEEAEAGASSQSDEDGRSRQHKKKHYCFILRYVTNGHCFVPIYIYRRRLWRLRVPGLALALAHRGHRGGRGEPAGTGEAAVLCLETCKVWGGPFPILPHIYFPSVVTSVLSLLVFGKMKKRDRIVE